MRKAEREQRPIPEEAVPSAERPQNLPSLGRAGDLLKPLTNVILERRATRHFDPDPVSDELLHAVLALGTQAPSGFNLQPWRFVVVRDAEARRRLFDIMPEHPGILEAPVVIAAFGMKEDFERHLEAVLRESARRGVDSLEDLNERVRQALDLLATVPSDVWVNRHTMVALSFMMLAAEAYGLDTLPLECFDARALKAELGVPPETEAVALLAIGKGKAPDKPYPGRFPMESVVFDERWGEPFAESAANIDVPTGP